MKNSFAYRTVAVPRVRIDRCVDSSVIKAIKSTTNMISGTPPPVNTVHADVTIASSARVFNVNINSVSNTKFKNQDRIVVVFRVDQRNNATTRNTFSKYQLSKDSITRPSTSNCFFLPFRRDPTVRSIIVHYAHVQQNINPNVILVVSRKVIRLFNWKHRIYNAIIPLQWPIVWQRS